MISAKCLISAWVACFLSISVIKGIGMNCPIEVSFFPQRAISTEFHLLSCQIGLFLRLMATVLLVPAKEELPLAA